MTIAEAAEKVLLDEKRPMRAPEIADIIIAKGLYQFRAKDPASVVASALHSYLAKQGASCAIEKLQPGVFSAKSR